MQSTPQIRIPERLRVVVTLSQLLAHLDVNVRPKDADQYRSVVRHLAEELERLDKDPALDFVLGNFPATAELYENLHYDRSGLSRSPLEASMNAELDARAVIERIARLPAV